MTEQMWTALIAAGIALAGTVVGAYLQHHLSLRADRIRRERDRRDEEARWQRDIQHESAVRVEDRRYQEKRKRQEQAVEEARRADERAEAELERIRDMLTEDPAQVTTADIEHILQFQADLHGKGGRVSRDAAIKSMLGLAGLFAIELLTGKVSRSPGALTTAMAAVDQMKQPERAPRAPGGVVVVQPSETPPVVKTAVSGDAEPDESD